MQCRRLGRNAVVVLIVLSYLILVLEFKIRNVRRPGATERIRRRD